MHPPEPGHGGQAGDLGGAAAAQYIQAGEDVLGRERRVSGLSLPRRGGGCRSVFQLQSRFCRSAAWGLAENGGRGYNRVSSARLRKPVGSCSTPPPSTGGGVLLSGQFPNTFNSRHQWHAAWRPRRGSSPRMKPMRGCLSVYLTWATSPFNVSRAVADCCAINASHAGTGTMIRRPFRVWGRRPCLASFCT